MQSFHVSSFSIIFQSFSTIFNHFQSFHFSSFSIIFNHFPPFFNHFQSFHFLIIPSFSIIPFSIIQSFNHFRSFQFQSFHHSIISIHPGTFDGARFIMTPSTVSCALLFILAPSMVPGTSWHIHCQHSNHSIILIISIIQSLRMQSLKHSIISSCQPFNHPIMQSFQSHHHAIIQSGVGGWDRKSIDLNQIFLNRFRAVLCSLLFSTPGRHLREQIF